ncbi:MAG: hypothetical protein HC902_13610, partial [Calothrix sp. SM1_5_4]|nr:hypothetical protein [Calothrix sp. SM1_5_4]
MACEPHLKSQLTARDVAREILKFKTVSFEASSVYHSFEAEQDAGVSYTCYMQFPDQVRVEMPDKTIMIADLKADKMLLYFADKKAVLLDKLSELGEGFGEMDQPANFISDLQGQFRAAEAGQGLGQMKYSFTTAVGLFSSAIGFLLLLTANIIS